MLDRGAAHLIRQAQAGEPAFQTRPSDQPANPLASQARTPVMTRSAAPRLALLLPLAALALAVPLMGLAQTLPAGPPPALSPSLLPVQPPAPALPHDLSPMGMYEQAHWVVKAVMLSLLFAAFLSWTVLLYKSVELWVARLRLRRSMAALRGASSLAAAAEALARRDDPAALMARAVAEEHMASAPALPTAGPEGVKERAASLVTRIEGQALAQLRRGTGLLATIGATAPFVGLFGTVWGIMNAFIGIAETKTTNLAVVAPGIAEALLATAIGLMAAIPAVVIYNIFARAIAGYRLHLGDAGAAVLRQLSRDLDLGR